ncbi:MAG: DUF1311 domain-containing protein [Leptolyngbya sp. Prado105]|jgi:uncharacterized protein YecT (DUF1311 family)|nr:DUF1311 domain-containing protein [Leptolyngbya sp. Prado105]
MKSRIAFAGMLLFISVAQVAAAQSVDYRAMYRKCLKDAGQTNNTSVMQCSEQTSEILEREIDRLYQKVYDRIAAQQMKDAQQFEFSHKSWMAYRNSQCKLAGAYVGSPMYSYCPMQMNTSRVVELRELAGE